MASLYVMCCSTPHLIARAQRQNRQRRRLRDEAEAQEERMGMAEIADKERAKLGSMA